MTNDLELKNTTSVPQKKTKKKRAASLDKRKARAGWWFVMPFILGFIIVYIPIIIDSLVYSFSTVEYTDFGPVTHFVGFANYENALFTDPDFSQTLVTGLQELLFDIPAIILFSLFMAVLLNQKMVGRAAFRAIFFLPVIILQVFTSLLSENTALLIILGIGLAFTLTHPLWMRNIYKRFMKRRYENMEGFRCSEEVSCASRESELPEHLRTKNKK